MSRDTSPAPVPIFGAAVEPQAELEPASPELAAVPAAPAPLAETTSPPPGLTIGAAVAALKAGQRVARAGWNGRGMWLKLFTPDPESDMTLPYVFMSTADGQLVPWLCSQTDLLAEDWSVLA
jgi:hypothetical protein